MSTPNPDTTLTSHVPDAAGRFGQFGGRYVPETLVRALDQLEVEYQKAREDAAFQSEYESLLANYVGRRSPLYFARRLTEHCGGAQIWLKREDLNHTGSHKINNTLGQALLTRRMGKRRPRFSIGDRPRDDRAVPDGDGLSAGLCRRLCRRWQQRGRDVLSVY